jgi:hypothetical protein
MVMVRQCGLSSIGTLYKNKFAFPLYNIVYCYNCSFFYLNSTLFYSNFPFHSTSSPFTLHVITLHFHHNVPHHPRDAVGPSD